MIFNIFYMFTIIPDDKIVSGGAKLSGNSSQNDHFFKTVPARLGAQKEKYTPLIKSKIFSSMGYLTYLSFARKSRLKNLANISIFKKL